MRVPTFSQLLSWGNAVSLRQTQRSPGLYSSDQAPFYSHEDLHTAGYIDGVRSGTSGASLTINVKHGQRNATAPLLGGLLFEDIAQSGDGGLYAELLRNRAFQGSGIAMGRIPQIPYRSITYSENPVIPFGPVLDGWTAVGDARLSLDLLHPLSDALQVSLQIDVPLDATGRVGVQNDGWWGIPVLEQDYNASFHVQASGVRFNWTITEFDVELRSALEENKVWCSNTIPVNGRLHPYAPAKFEGKLSCDVKAPNINNTFAVTFDAEQARGQTLYFSLFSLFPPTYKDRPNGLRKDLADQLEAMSPKFLRFPGGNNLEGYSVQRRWKWWKTIGPLEDRPGRPGDWSYYNTDGLGLLEYLIWCEDMDMEPLLAVYAGFSLDIAVYDGSNSTDANEAPWSQMPAILQEALDELEYCMGDAVTTFWGKKRAEHGHPEPFSINLIEIGNEDWFSHDYPRRARFMYESLKEAYPNMTFVFSSLDESKEWHMHIPKDHIWDGHVYAPSGWFIKHADYWDNFRAGKGHDRPNHPVDPPNMLDTDDKISSRPDTTHVMGSLMEYHASAVGVNGVLNTHPRMGAAVAEAVYAIGGERNPDTYKLSCFAPLMQNINAWRRTPYDLLFESDPEKTVLSASYWQQWLFNRYPGKETLEVHEATRSLSDGTAESGWNPLFWVASIEPGRHGSPDKVYFKIANAGNTSQHLELALDIPFTSANGTILEPPTQGDLFAYNTLENAAISPKPIWNLDYALRDNGHGTSAEVLLWDVPAFSISVLQFDLKKTGHRTAGQELNDEL